MKNTKPLETLGISSLWEAFLQAEGDLKLKVLSLDSCSLIKARLSTYKSRALAKDKALARELGAFCFTFSEEQVTEGKDKGKWILTISQRQTKERKQLEVEIL